MTPDIIPHECLMSITMVADKTVIPNTAFRRREDDISNVDEDNKRRTIDKARNSLIDEAMLFIQNQPDGDQCDGQIAYVIESFSPPDHWVRKHIH